MYNIELRIKVIDWLYILIIGIVFATLLSSLGYVLLQLDWVQGAYFGAMLGFSITFFSLLFITFMNQVILPKIAKVFWLWRAITPDCMQLAPHFKGRRVENFKTYKIVPNLWLSNTIAAL